MFALGLVSDVESNCSGAALVWGSLFSCGYMWHGSYRVMIGINWTKNSTQLLVKCATEMHTPSAEKHGIAHFNVRVVYQFYD